MKKLILIIIVTVSFLFPQAYEKAGTAGNQSLKLGSSARAIGMGDAFSPLMGELGQIYYNPAGVYSKRDIEVAVMYSRYIGQINIINIAGKKKIKKFGDIGLAVSSLFTGQLEVQDPTALATDIGGKVKSGTVNAVLNYSKLLADYISVGGNLKFVTDSFASEYLDFNFGIDLGSILSFGLFNPELEGLTFSLLFNNVGTPTKIEGLKFNMPFTFRSGLAYKWDINDNNQLLTSGDFEKGNDRSLKFNLGMQYKIYQYAVLRMGYRIGDGKNGFKFGAGADIKGYTLDYAFDYGAVGVNNRIEFGFGYPPKTGTEKEDMIKTLYYLGLKKFTQDDMVKSRKYFELILKIDPKHSKARERIKEINDLEKKRRNLELFKQSMEELF